MGVVIRIKSKQEYEQIEQVISQFIIFKPKYYTHDNMYNFMILFDSEYLKLNVPVILFGVGASHLVHEWNDLPIDVLGLDWRLSIKEANDLNITKTLQGNLDPSLLLAPWEVIEPRLKPILDQGLAHGKHIFNLVHGVFLQVTP